MIGTITSIHRYPVKSMAGEILLATTVGENGLPGDRAWAVRDEVNGGIRGAKKLPDLMKFHARYLDEPTEVSSAAEIELPDGRKTMSTSHDINDVLTAALDHQVTLWPIVSADSLDHYRRGAPTHEDIMVELRSIFGRTEDEPLPDLSQFPPELMEFESPPGTYFDAYPILIITEESLATMQAAREESVFDVRRFRPNFVVKLDEPSESEFPEFEWIGKSVRIGDCEMKIELDCPRCIMVTRDFQDLPNDPKIMRTLVQQNGGKLGVYASVTQPGRVRSGDAIELLPSS